MAAGIDFELLKQELIHDEGNRDYPYDDATGQRLTSLSSGGNLTIGIGRNLFAKPLSKAVRDLMWREDVNDAINDCISLYPNFDLLSRARKHALINMAFNMGRDKLSTFKKMNAAVRAQDWPAAAREAKDSAWYRQVSPRRAYPIIDALLNG